MTTETFLSSDGLDTLRALIGEQLLAYGTDLELDDGIAAFGAWVRTAQGWVGLEFVEEVVDFDAGFTSVESLLTVHPLTDVDPGGDAHELTGRIETIHRIQDRVTMINKRDDAVEWDWWRDSGVRITLDTGAELVLHCGSTIEIEVVMRTGPAGTVEPAPLATRSYQEGEKRRYTYERREVALDA